MTHFVIELKTIAQLQLRSAGTSGALALLLSLVFVADLLVGSPEGESVRSVDGWLGYSDAGISAGEAWRIATPNLLHTSPTGPGPVGSLHLLGNTMVLLLYGPYVERRLGRRRFVGIAAIAGITAFGWLPVLDRPETSVGGSSGMIWGLIVAGAVLSGLAVWRPNTELDDVLILLYTVGLSIFVAAELALAGVLLKHLIHLGSAVGGAAAFRLTSSGDPDGRRLLVAALALWAALAAIGLAV